MHLCSTYVLKSPQSSFCSHIERFLALWYAPFQFSVVLKAHNNASLRIIPSSYSYDRYQNQTRLFKMSPQLTSVDFLGQDTHLSLCSGSAASNGTCIHPTFIISLYTWKARVANALFETESFNKYILSRIFSLVKKQKKLIFYASLVNNYCKSKHVPLTWSFSCWVF